MPADVPAPAPRFVELSLDPSATGLLSRATALLCSRLYPGCVMQALKERAVRLWVAVACATKANTRHGAVGAALLWRWHPNAGTVEVLLLAACKAKAVPGLATALAGACFRAQQQQLRARRVALYAAPGAVQYWRERHSMVEAAASGGANCGLFNPRCEPLCSFMAKAL